MVVELFSILLGLLVFDVKAFLWAGVIFIPLERVLPLHRGQRTFRRWWHQDLVYVFANGALIRLGLGAVMVVILGASGRLVPEGLRGVVAHQPCWLQVVEAVILADLGFYVAHRMFHSVPWLWRFHAIHHSIEELDWLAGVRVHPLDQVVTKGMSMLPLLTLGFDTVAIAISSVIYFWHSVLLHANIRVTFGPLRWLIASPVFHHWHHANLPDARGKNYAGQLSILDKMFGTMYMPEGQAPHRYGGEDRVPPTYISQLLYPFRRSRGPKGTLPVGLAPDVREELPSLSGADRANEMDRVRLQPAPWPRAEVISSSLASSAEISLVVGQGPQPFARYPPIQSVSDTARQLGVASP